MAQTFTPGPQKAQKTQTAFFVVLIGCLTLALSAQQEAPFSYAITGARIVPVSSAPIENGTVVFSGGVITAVGGSVPVPQGAITIAGKGMTVYPGLIDMGSSAGLEAPAVSRAESPQTTEDVERVKRDTLLRPQLRAADYMNPAAAALARAAEAGITAILATPASDGIRGQSALVLTSIGADVPQIGALADDRRGPLVCARRSLHVGIATSPPAAMPANSLMGSSPSTAGVLDAQWYQQAAKTTPRAYSPAMDAMQPALAGRYQLRFAPPPPAT